MAVLRFGAYHAGLASQYARRIAPPLRILALAMREAENAPGYDCISLATREILLDVRKLSALVTDSSFAPDVSIGFEGAMAIFDAAMWAAIDAKGDVDPDDVASAAEAIADDVERFALALERHAAGAAQ